MIILCLVSEGKKKKKPELLNSRFFKLIIFHFENEYRYGGTDEEKGDGER